MRTLDFTERDVGVLRSLMAAEPVPGEPLPPGDAVARIDALIPCDLLAVGYVDLTGLVSAKLTVTPSDRGPAGILREHLHEQHDGPFHLGVMHWRRHPAQAEMCEIFLRRGEDALAMGFRNGTDHVVQYVFVRTDRFFTERDLAVFGLIGPVLQRLARERPTPALPALLTTAERRVLCEVAAGRSNAEIAEGSCIAVSTVRKHLENAYRKLGVTNRVAAIARLRGSDQPGLDLRERVERYA